MKYELIKSNDKHIPFTVLKKNEKDVVLTNFISFTLPSFLEEIKECFDNVLNGKEKEIEGSYNDKTIIINKEITKMIDDWHDDAEYYVVNTKELYDLICKYIENK